MFIGREEYLEDLESLWQKGTSSLVACRGRRRIGKSTLFREFARRTADVYIEIEGLMPESGMTNEMQLRGFAESLAAQTGTEDSVPTNWLNAFIRLDREIDDTKRTIVMLDEISWMGGYDKLFAATLRKAWERYFHRHDRLILILCGSVSSWIKDELLGSTGFTGRFSRDFVLPELTLKECAGFWGQAADRISPREIVDVLSITGGVPRYLEEVNPALDANENIRKMCFLKSGELFRDFDAIFNPVFGEDVVIKKDILRILADGPCTGAELAEKLGSARNGHLSAHLRELKEGGFLSDDCGINPETGRRSRIAKYRLKDNYTRFYLKYVMPHKAEIELGTYRFSSLDRLPEWHTVMGLQFENLIVNNAMDVVPHLHLGGATVESAAPYRNSRKDGGGKKTGCQIDLLIQTPRTAYVVEVKRRNEIDSTIEDEVAERIKRLPLREGMSARPVLVYDGKLDPVVEGNGYFDAVIPVSKLLGVVQYRGES